MGNREQKRISTLSKDKVIVDFFPDALDADEIENVENISDRELSLHAGALCLYATLLMTKIHETDPMKLEPSCEDRINDLKALAKAEPKYAAYTDDQINNLVNNMIKVDIRNCFAHGNFEINYDIYTQKMNFVLHPMRRDLVSNEPIVIDKNSIMKANKEFIAKNGEEYQMKAMLSELMIDNAVTTNLSKTLKEFILPTQMQKLTDYYIGKKHLTKSQVLFDENIYYMVQYILSSAKITYEQQDYYDIFGKDSNVFGAIALIRNSLAHDSLEFVDNANGVSYVDKHISKTESVAESASKLLIADSHKQLIKNLLAEGKHSEDAINRFKDKLKEIFDFFFDGTYKFEDVAGVWIENAKEKE